MIDYRWTAVSPNIFGVHFSVLAPVPLILASSVAWWSIAIVILYAGFLYKASRKRFGPLQYIQFLRVHYLYRYQWRARP